MDEAQHEFDAFVDLCVDLDALVADAARAGGEIAEAELYAHVGLPLCERVRVWAQESRAAGECLLQFGQGGGAGEDSVREVRARVLQLVYFGMALKFDYSDRARCEMRQSSLYVAVTRIVDAADWVVTTGRTFLWCFAEPALLLARDFLLDTRGCDAGPLSSLVLPSQAPARSALSTGDVSLLEMIANVFRAALAAMAEDNPQRVVAAYAVESVASALR
ncbi:hypothetical protein POSPLADRAFT_1039887 [Postia placenta MAD-698-R-SB12]|uniref:Transcription factor domain-containing protein n=1 Tax=Postia placenta MAD-698-R-SB12 TaxID=670580 RepID=A0A1X6N042_9APHY|nr:hypothetical protein POSPLADRAFT_1039887 [Postia placenta MAD-698-R-SB12]OSX61988.1 hypothetical protein POSPLADRAFT_1039887 [Postia placenta MAD-698-R-SB12]